MSCRFRQDSWRRRRIARPPPADGRLGGGLGLGVNAHHTHTAIEALRAAVLCPPPPALVSPPSLLPCVSFPAPAPPVRFRRGRCVDRHLTRRSLCELGAR